MSEDDQDRILDQSLKVIQAQSYHIHTTIEKNNLRQCLKETFTMLNELRTNKLTPKNYYHLYTSVFDEMQHITNFFKEEIKRGRRIRDLYDSVQQSMYIIPRMYLLITSGSIYIENYPKSCREVIFDLLAVVKGVQNPIRGLFTRYYLLKSIKDKLPDKNNIYDNEGGNFDDTLKFIIQNLDEMNRLWIRLSMGVIGEEKKLREKDRNELKILIGENITRLASLEGLSNEIYQREVLPKILNIIIESKDQLSQQYLMECIIHAFPDEFNISCLDSILNCTKKLVSSVDIKNLFIGLLEKLSKFVKNSDAAKEQILNNSNTIFSILKESFDNLIKENCKEGNNMDIVKVIESQCSFMKFIIISCVSDNKLELVNYVLNLSDEAIKSYGEKLDNSAIKSLTRLLSSPLESELSLFDLNQFPKLMNNLDFNSKNNLSLRIIESFVNGKSNEKLDSVDKIKKLLNFIKPLLEDLPDSTQDDFQFEYDQYNVAKLIFVVNTNDPEILYNIYKEFQNVFINGGAKRKKITLPSLINAIINLCYSISIAYDEKNNNYPQEKKNEFFNDRINSIDISKINSNDNFYDTMIKFYKLINDIIQSLNQEQPIISFKLYLQAALQVNSINSNKEKFEEACVSFINSAFGIYADNKYEGDYKYSLLNLLSGYLLYFNNLSKENIENFIKNIQSSAHSLFKRSDQCNSMIFVSQLYFSLLKDYKSVIECLEKAKKFADLSMTNPQNLNLFVIILNKMIYYIENSDEMFIQSKFINDINEVIQSHIETLHNENKFIGFLPEIENYYTRTVDMIKIRREIGKKGIYSEITNIDIK